MNQSLPDSHFLTFITGGHCRFWSINPYHLCNYRCTYCITGVQGDARPSLGTTAQSLAALARALRGMPAAHTIILGGISDAYPDSERKLKLTREIVKLLIAEKRPFCIITKSTLVERDADLLEGYAQVRVEFSFSTLDDHLAATYELDAPPPSKRLHLLKTFAARGIAVKLALRPWIPDISLLHEFLAEVPATIPIGLERLKIMRASQSINIAGQTYTQAGIDAAYLAEREKYRGCKRLKWSYDARFASVRRETGIHPVDIILKDNRSSAEHPSTPTTLQLARVPRA